MLISESRFRKIINEELKKLMKEGMTLEPTPIAGTAPDPKLENKISILRNEKLIHLNDFFKKAIAFLTKYRGAQSPNPAILSRNWETVKTKPDPPPGTNIQTWLYGTDIAAIVSTLIDLKDPKGSLFKILCVMSSQGTKGDVQNLNAEALFEKFSGKKMTGTDGRLTPEANEFLSAVLPADRRAAGVIADLESFLNPVRALKVAQQKAAAAAAAAGKPAAGTPAAPGTAAPAQSFTYTIKQGDSITKVLQRYYKFNPTLWAKLPAADTARIAQMFGTNNPDAIVPKLQVILPATLVLGGVSYNLQASQPVVPAAKPPTAGAKPAIVNRP